MAGRRPGPGPGEARIGALAVERSRRADDAGAEEPLDPGVAGVDLRAAPGGRPVELVGEGVPGGARVAIAEPEVLVEGDRRLADRVVPGGQRDELVERGPDRG